jgi:hypothetical protein
MLEMFLQMLIFTSRVRRRSAGAGVQARRRRFMGLFITYRCIEETRARMFRKRDTILYPSFEFILVRPLIHGEKGMMRSSFVSDLAGP